MARERIDNLTEATHLDNKYWPVRIEDVRPDDHVGPRPVHGVTGTGMNGFEVDLAQLAKAEQELADLHEPLIKQMQLAAHLTEDPGDGSGPVAAAMRRAFLRRAGTDGGVQETLRAYMEELFKVRQAILDTLRTYQRVDGDVAARLRQQMTELRTEAH